MRLILTIIAVAAPALALAQERPPADALADDRFQLERSAEGYVRLDRRTGAVSVCTVDGGSLNCRAGADERAALQEEIDRLAGEVDRLQQRLAAADPNAPPEERRDELTLKLPSEDEVNRVLGFFEDIVRRIADFVRSIDLGSGEKT